MKNGPTLGKVQNARDPNRVSLPSLNSSARWQALRKFLAAVELWCKQEG
jgi:hypothetical protein